MTWVLIWCLPPVVLWRGIRREDRFVMGVGGIIVILTFVTNKPYLGWPRHTWDPMILGVALAGVALWIRRWLAHAPGGVRGGFTAARLSGKDKQWMSVSASVLGLVTPQAVTPSPQAKSADFRLRWRNFGRRRCRRRFLINREQSSRSRTRAHLLPKKMLREESRSSLLCCLRSGYFGPPWPPDAWLALPLAPRPVPTDPIELGALPPPPIPPP